MMMAETNTIPAYRWGDYNKAYIFIQDDENLLGQSILIVACMETKVGYEIFSFISHL